MRAIRLFLSIDFTRSDPNCLRWANKLAELAGNTLLAAIRIFHQSGHTTVVVWNIRPLIGILKRNRFLKHVAKGSLETAGDLREKGFLRKCQRLTFNYFRLSHSFSC